MKVEACFNFTLWPNGSPAAVNSEWTDYLMIEPAQHRHKSKELIYKFLLIRKSFHKFYAVGGGAGEGGTVQLKVCKPWFCDKC
jgi:hypothetical protein